MSADQQPTTKARLQKRGSFAGTGCLIQAFGLVVGLLLVIFIPVVGWVLGPLAAIALLINGSQKSIKWECGNCHNPVASGRVNRCPSCGITLHR